MYSFTFVIFLLAAKIAVLEAQTTAPLSRDPCRNFTCRNNGTCTSPIDFPFCQCPDGFGGDRCEKVVLLKKGTCPKISDENASCQKTCDGDFDCPGAQKCCPTFCRRVCANSVTDPPIVPPPTLTCATVLCITGTICRHVVTCPNCPFRPVCIKPELVEKGIDTTCRSKNYVEVLLQQYAGNSTPYSPLTCPERLCPSDSDCIEGTTGQMVCCRGRLGPVSPPRVKQGQCAKNILICGGTLCQDDDGCPGAQKCCPACGTNICSNPIMASTGEKCGNSFCALGEVCVQRTPTCAPGMACIQALLPTCVPRGCAKCSPKERCRNTVRGHECYIPNTVDQCGGCAAGQVCKPTGIVCIRAPCPGAFKCVPTDRCGGVCP